ncbi:hypothetical protein [Nonomuraea sp. NPDC046570]|uniref:WXG100-like domain-containing protein n=1 Tax=Nonomuraea sp. NPDC046570 TaxID=3155255 RepID=UPI0033EC11EA
MSATAERQPSLNPLNWNWSPTTWGWDINLGSALDPTPLIETILALARALPTLFGDDGSEGRLRQAAAAHNRLAEDLQVLEDAIDGPMEQVLKSWTGPAAGQFRDVWGQIVNKENRHALRTNCTECAKVLTAVADSVKLTKDALVEIIKTALIWAGAFYAIRFAALYWAQVVAAFGIYARATQLVVMAAQLLSKLAGLFRFFGRMLKALPLIGKLKFSPKLTALAGRVGPAMRAGALKPFDHTFLTGLTKASFGAYAKTSGWVFAGVLGTQMTAQVFRGNSFFNISPATLVQSMRITTAATLVGTFAPLGLFWKSTAQGGAAASWAASMTKSGLAVGEGGLAFAQFVGARNWTIGLSKWAPTGKVIGPDAAKQILGFAPTSVFRVWRPLHTTEEPRLDPYKPPAATVPPGTPAPQNPSAKMGIWPYANGSLKDIAEKVYGDRDRWQEIYATNRDQIGPDPRKIPPGTILRYPLDEPS